MYESNELSLKCHFGTLVVLLFYFSANTLLEAVGIDPKHVKADEARRGRGRANQPADQVFPGYSWIFQGPS